MTLEELMHDKNPETGESVTVTFKMKPEHKDVLRELTDLFPRGWNQSDVIRAMILPYVQALTMAKEGHKWKGALLLGSGLTILNKILDEAEKEANQEELDFNASVQEVPNG